MLEYMVDMCAQSLTSNIRLSVIIPGYNTSEALWRRCVASVRQACGPDDEIICIDDGSKKPVQEGWLGADVDSRVRLARKENGGLASARNAGMKLMRGRFVTFVDSDDEVRKDTYDRVMAALETSGADIAVYGVEVIWVRELLHKIDAAPNRYYGLLTPNDILFLQRLNLLNYACNKVYSVEFITGTRCNSTSAKSFDLMGMPCEDIIFNLECIMDGAKWVSVDYVGYVYYRAGITLLSSYNPSLANGIVAGAKAWQRFALTLDEKEHELFKTYYDLSSVNLENAEWKNMWRSNTPYSLRDRWRWLRMHSNLGGSLYFLKTLAFWLARRYFYITPIRRMKIRHLYPQAKTWKGMRA